jgi:hypothetical protein
LTGLTPFYTSLSLFSFFSCPSNIGVSSKKIASATVAVYFPFLLFGIYCEMPDKMTQEEQGEKSASLLVSYSVCNRIPLRKVHFAKVTGVMC